MNSKYFFKYTFILLLLIILIVGFLQRFRIKRLESYFSVKQVYDFTLPNGKNGRLKIEKPEKYIIFYSDEKGGIDEIRKGLEEIFNISKVKYDIKSISTTEEIDYKNYSMVILVAENYSGLTKKNFLKIKNYIKNGGNLFLTERSYKNPFNSISGIKKIGKFIETKTFIFTKEIFPGFKNINPKEEILNSSGLDLILNENVDIIAKTSNGIPLMWINAYGKGRVFYNNTTLFQGKIFRGVMKQLIAYMSDVSFYPIINSKVFHIDDYPSPIPVLENEVIKKEYGMNTNEFYNTIWWNSMKEFFKKQRIIPTGLLIGEYNDATTKSKLVSVCKRTLGDLSKRGRQLKSVDGELAIHGYNHYSLGLKNEILFSRYHYKPWESVETMEKAQQILKSTMKKLYGKNLKIYTYIPPSNLISKNGKEVIIKNFPEINSFCGIFYGEEEPGLLLQEIGRDKDFSHIYSLPRMSSGFFYTETILWQIYNGIAAYGYVSHFIHPDDVIDKERGAGKSWKELESELDRIFTHINKNYSPIEPQTQSEMTYEYIKIENLKIAYEKKADKILINICNFKGAFDSQLRIKGEKIKNIKGGRFILIEETNEYTLYLLTAEKSEIEIETEKMRAM